MTNKKFTTDASVFTLSRGLQLRDSNHLQPAPRPSVMANH